MLAAQCLTFPSPITRPSRGLGPSPITHTPKLQAYSFNQVKANAAMQDPLVVDYTSSASVFPAEACETIGGEACEVKMFPEGKIESQDKSSSAQNSSRTDTVNREYYEYSSQKTVFPGEACDDLGGEFCEEEYQRGVH